MIQAIKVVHSKDFQKILHAELIWFANINSAAGVIPDTTIIFNHPNPQFPTSVVAESIR